MAIIALSATIVSCQKDTINDFDPNFDFGEETVIKRDTIITHPSGNGITQRYNVSFVFMNSSHEQNWLCKQTISAIDSATSKPVPFKVEGNTITLEPDGISFEEAPVFYAFSPFDFDKDYPDPNYRIKLMIADKEVMLSYLCYYVCAPGANRLGDIILTRC